MPRAAQTAGLQPMTPAEIEVAVASAESLSALADERDDPVVSAGAANANEATTARPVVEPVVRSRARAPRSPVLSTDAGMTNAAPSLAPSSPEGDAPSTPLHFVMSVGAAAPPGLVVAPSGGATETQGEAVFGEDGVDARPRLLAWQAPRYPPSAASAGVEVDVPVDVVIDTEGLVSDVRLPKHFGYGLDEAAIATAQSYRFSRGLKGGRPVRVRMRCTVMFRLN
jgi:TonB family protein